MEAKIKMADLVLMHGCIWRDILYTYEQFGVDRKLCVEVIRLDASRRRKEIVSTVTPTRCDTTESFP